MDIIEVEAILGLYRFVPKPYHLIVIDEPVGEVVDGVRFYRGLQPRGRSDVMVLTAHATDETVVHEAMHCLGFDEVGATILGKALIWKSRALQSFPFIKSLVQQPVRYEKCTGCEQFKLLHSKYSGRATHYKKVKGE